MSDLPGGAIANRPLRFFWMLDVSGSMKGEKVGQLNFAIREALPEMRRVADDNAHAAIEMRVLTFGTGYKWVTPAPVPLEQFTWSDVSVNGLTDMGKALEEMANELAVDKMPERSLPPVIVLISDGQPTDDFDKGLQALMAQPWGSRSIRIAIAIGSDADKEPLQKFIGHSEIEPLEANNSADLVNYIRWVSTQVLKAASSPASQPPDQQASVPPSAMDMVPPAPPADPSADDVW